MEPPIPTPSALTQFLTPASSPHHALALQIQHNLQHQHDWTSLRIHTHSPLPPHALLPRPLISGLPPQRIYVHPDEQVEMLKVERQGGKVERKREREWVLPTQLREKWSLRRFAEVFDAVGEEPPGNGEGAGEGEGEGGGGEKDWEGGGEVEKRRGGKRVLMAMVGDDSTVVYYIVHDGIVKPRQN